MDWVKSFYAKQDALVGVYTGDLADNGRSKAAVIGRLPGAGCKRILELGAGGGQAAAVATDLGHDVVAVELVPAEVVALTSRPAGRGDARYRGRPQVGVPQ